MKIWIPDIKSLFASLANDDVYQSINFLKFLINLVNVWQSPNPEIIRIPDEIITDESLKYKLV